MFLISKRKLRISQIFKIIQQLLRSQFRLILMKRLRKIIINVKQMTKKRN